MPITLEKQAVSNNTELSWKWEILPKKIGKFDLHFAVTQFQVVDGGKKVLPILSSSFPKEVNINNPNSFEKYEYLNLDFSKSQFFILIILGLFLIYYIFIIWNYKWEILFNLGITHQFNRTISQYFASPNNLILISFFMLILAFVISHEIWSSTDDKASAAAIFGGGALIFSYFLNGGIKLYTEMRDHSLKIISEASENAQLKIDMKEIFAYFSILKKIMIYLTDMLSNH